MSALLVVFCLLIAPAEDSIRAVLNDQVTAWNRGDIEAFMQGYLDSPTLTFAGKSGVTRGYQPVMERYKKAYSTKDLMGELAYKNLEIRLLNPDAALVLGQFELTRSEKGGGNASGRFSLVFQKTPAGWKIIHDHTS
jgi:uncharacterized protein (TIGR02246 family)